MDDIRFVLVRPGQGGNVGAAARALKNMGSSALWLVDSRPYDAAEAERMAHNATDVLVAARRVATLPEALADCRWVAGTTRRDGRRRRPTLDARELAHAVHAQPERRPLAIVFGPEEGGLEMSELALCHDTVRIPSAAAQPSLNLSQAVLVIAYELFVARLATVAAQPARAARVEAEAALLEPLYAHLEQMLLAVGFVRPDTAPHRMLALRRILGRSRLGPGDVRLLRGICRQVLWATAVRTPAANGKSSRGPAPRPRSGSRRAPVPK